MELYSAAGVLLAFVNTNASGQYYFVGDGDDDATWQVPNTKLQSNTSYYIIAGGNGQYASGQNDGRWYDLSSDSQ